MEVKGCGEEPKEISSSGCEMGRGHSLKIRNPGTSEK